MPRFEIRVNGQLRTIEADPGDSLLTILRDDLGLTGSKYGCGEGHCGACTVLLGGQATRSCVTRVGTIGSRSVTTIEGLATGSALHPVQEAFLEEEAFQCGYCTTGMVMATVGLLKNAPNPSDADIARLMDRNICRCGTYPRIVQAVKSAARRMTASSDGGAR